MSTLTTIQATDLITNSRADINGNFSALNTDKMETSVLDTDTTLAANSDSKVATQKAVKAYVDAGGNVNASETNKGIVEEATDAEVTAGTATGGTGAKLAVTPAKLATRLATLTTLLQRPALTIIPQPATGSDGGAPTTFNVSQQTVAWVGQVIVPFYITVNKISFRTSTVAVAGTLDLTLYSEDGQTQYFSVTSASVSGNTLYTVSVSSVALAPGIYYLMFNSNAAGTDATISSWSVSAVPFSTTAGLGEDVTSEPVVAGTYTITAATPPATLTPTSITGATNATAIVRLDN